MAWTTAEADGRTLKGRPAKGGQNTQLIAEPRAFFATQFGASDKYVRLVARWHLGERLAKIERGHGPGRGKKGAANAVSFLAVCQRIKLDTSDATDAQRIACLPPAELEAFCGRDRRADRRQKGNRPNWVRCPI